MANQRNKGMYHAHEEIIPTEYVWQRIKRKLCYKVYNLPLFRKDIQAPVFVIGSGRSGTTLLMKSIENHPKICSYPGEALDLWLPYNFPWRDSKLETPPYWINPETFTVFNLEKWSSSDTRKIKGVFSSYFGMSKGSVFLNKCAMSAHLVPKMIELYPNAKFINIIRDGRAVALSYAKLTKARINKFPAAYSKLGYNLSDDELLLKMAELWNHQVLSIDNDLKQMVSKENYIEVTYEDFCDAPHNIMASLYDFLNLNHNQIKESDFVEVRKVNYHFDQRISQNLLSQMEIVMEEALKLKGYK